MTIALRPYLAADAPILAAIYAAAIDELTAEDYTDEQRYAWIALAEDEQTFGQKLAASLTLVAIVEGEPVGFISLSGETCWSKRSLCTTTSPWHFCPSLTVASLA